MTLVLPYLFHEIERLAEIKMLYKKIKKGMVFSAAFMALAMTLTGCESLEGIELGDFGIKESQEDEKYQLIQDYIDAYYLYDVEEEKEQEAKYRALLEGLDDPYSCYYSQEEYTELMESYVGEFCGIGASFVIRKNEDVPFAVSVFKDSGAEEAGLLAGDRIIAIEGEDIAGESLDDLVQIMRGDEGTKVNITVYRESTDEYIDFNITRKKITIETVEYRMLESNIGYIEVYSFDEPTDEQFMEAIDDLEAQGMQSLIIDLRNNGGGLLTSMVTMLDYILPEERLIYCLDKNGKNIGTEYSTNEHQVELPIVILINGYSASASECFSGTMQDYGAATIVGTKSYGKGVMQQIYELPDGSGIKLTIAAYYTGGGRNIHGTGITPDVEVELPDKVESIEDDTQLNKAKEILVEQMKKEESKKKKETK